MWNLGTGKPQIGVPGEAGGDREQAGEPSPVRTGVRRQPAAGDVNSPRA